MSLSPTEARRYLRHFALPDFGYEGQLRLKKGRVLVVGAGGLGCPMLLYLAAAGVGHIGIVDGDVVDETNLQRQVLYTTADIGRSKAEVARERLQALNPFVEITAYPVRLIAENAADLLAGYDLVADGTDNFTARYLINNACVAADKPHVFAAVFRYEGHLSVFNYLNDKGIRSPTYQMLFPQPPAPGTVPDCAEAGVLGVLPGILGAMQANEVLKILSRTGEVMAGRLLIYDAATGESRVLKLHLPPFA